MIRICRDFLEIVRYKEYSFYKNGSDSIPAIVLSENCFLEAGRLFADGHVLVEVILKNGETLFYLKECRDMIEGPNGTYGEVDLNFSGWHLLGEKNIDTRLLETTEAFVFEELEEYTYEITELIRDRFPNALIFYLDKYAKCVWNDRVVVLDSIRDIKEICKNRFMFVCEDRSRHAHAIPEDVSLVYNSGNVMHSLCWARKVEHLGTKNKGKTILLIDMEFGLCGLAYIIRTVCTLACMAQERGWIPVANLTGNNMYIDSNTSNMWEQYFEPLSDITVQEALESANVIRVNNPAILEINPYFRQIWLSTERHPVLKCNKETMKFFINFMPKEIADKQGRILGAFIRGTDAKTAVVSENEANDIALKCKEIMEHANFDKIFLATEDMVYFKSFVHILGDKLIYVEQKRVMSSSGVNIPIGKLLGINEGEKGKFGLTYLMITYCLSQCKAIVYNIPSGGYYLANRWNKGAYEFSYHIAENRMEIENIVKCFKMIEKNNLIAIYGTGLIGKRLLEIFGGKRAGKVLFCDKKAEQEEYLFNGYRVISPKLLLEQYKCGYIKAIIIASSVYAEEIYNSLIASGVDARHVMVIKNYNGVI